MEAPKQWAKKGKAQDWLEELISNYGFLTAATLYMVFV
ncbi:hypothetical protein M23134_00644 [Microscilla marina ATCC 23134]|uniref:Uncharacterized protein n=1 Tax=Microscilla marina ATCC 23134 TaxID=313606 RepID=A1ZVK3_MICM2|nr:hypothetical protein M23134_00644 [Microscilla marina ATCC 23134]